MHALFGSLRARLALLALIAVLPAVVVIVVDQSIERRDSRAHALDDLVRRSHDTAAQEAGVLAGVRRHLMRLAQFPALHGSEPADCSQFLATVLRERSQYLNIWLADRNGLAACAGRSVEGLPALGSRAWFNQAVTGRTAAVGAVQTESDSHDDIAVAYPLFAPTGAVDHMLVATLSLDQLNGEAATGGLLPGMTLTLTDRDRRILVRYPDSSASTGKDLPPALEPRPPKPGMHENVVETADVDGVRRVCAVVPLIAGADTGLYLIVGTESAAMFGGSAQLLHRHLWLLGFVTLLAVGGAIVGGELFVHRPVQALKQATKRIAEGDFDGRAQLITGAPGLADLREAINTMAGELELRQQALRVSEFRYRFLFDENPYPKWVYDTETQSFLEVNRSATELYGFTRAEFLAMRMGDILAPGDAHPTIAPLSKPADGGWDQVRLCRHRKKSGDIIDVQITTHALIFDGRPAELVIAHDVSQHQRAEAALRETEERFQFALTAAHVGVWEANLKTGVAYWSGTCEAMHGLPLGSFGRTFGSFLDCVHPDDREQVKQTIDDAVRAHRRPDIEYRTVWPDGTERCLNCTADFSYDDAGVPLRGAGIVVDVTERRSLEDQLRQSQKMEAIGQLAGGIAHDFNNVLVAILGNADFVVDRLAPEDPSRQDLDEIVKAAHRAANLTQQLLTFSRKQMVSLEVVDLGVIVNEVTPMLRRVIGETVELQAVVKNEGSVKADRGQTEQVLINLAVNARDAMPEGGLLTIETADVVLDDDYARSHAGVSAGPYVMIAVTDSGSGMDARTKARVFEPFFTTKPKGRGTGLGLATVYGIVKQSGGHIWVYSEPGRGSTFKVYLPRTRDAGHALHPMPDATTRGGTETVLIVEDEESVRDFVRKVLTRNGYTVYAFADPADAIGCADAHRGAIDIMLTDVVLPGMSGPALAASVSERHPEVLVTYMSGYTDDTVVRHGVLDAKLSFLQKPFTASALLKKVRNMLDARGTVTAA